MGDLESKQEKKSDILRYLGMALLAISSVVVGALSAQLFPFTQEAPIPAPYLAHGEPTPVPALDIGNPNIFVELAKQLVPSVVNISTLTSLKTPYGMGNSNDMFRWFFEDFFNRHGGRSGPSENEEPPNDRLPPGTRKAASLGTGFIIDSAGLILTNSHVVAEADEIKIHFTEENDEEPTDGEVVGRDMELDLALIRVKSKRELKSVVFGDSDSLEVGEYVIAVGNPFGQGHSVTHGIISAKDRRAPGPLQKYLQTDAPINPGNSGGPLVNLKGEVIGINNAIDARAQGIGFAIPANLVKAVLPQLKEKGTVSRGYIGILVDDLTPDIAEQVGADEDLKAAYVAGVNEGQAADHAGVKPGDVILEFNRKKIHSAQELIEGVTAVPVGTQAKILILRDGREKNLEITVAERPGEKRAAKAMRDKEDKEKRIYTGMEIEGLTLESARQYGHPENVKGVVIEQLDYDGPAARSGLNMGDVILEVERKPIETRSEFQRIVKDRKSYLLKVRRPTPEGGVSLALVLDLREK